MGQFGRGMGAGCLAAALWVLPCSAPFLGAQQEQPASGSKSRPDKPAPDKSSPEKSGKNPEPKKAVGDVKPEGKKPGKALESKQDKKEIRRGERSDIEARCLAFAREHHPELSDLLERLAAMDEAAFRKAIVDLHRDVDRIDKVREKTPARHQGELERWKIESRIRLLAARGAMSDSPEHEAELRAAIEERVSLRTRLLKEEKALVETRLQRINDSLAELQKDRQKLIDSEVARLRKSAGSAKAARKTAVTARDQKRKTRPEGASKNEGELRGSTSVSAPAKKSAEK